MTNLAAPEIQPMSFEEYWALPEELRAEFVDGEAIVSPPPSYAHQRICGRLYTVLDQVVSEPLEVVLAAGWRLPGLRDQVRIPDVMVVRSAPTGLLVTEPPLVVVEVLSSHRRDDLVRKSTAYLQAGVGQYWTVDSRDRTIDVFENTSHGWQPLAHLDDRHPEAMVTVAGSAVALSVPDLLGTA